MPQIPSTLRNRPLKKIIADLITSPAGRTLTAAIVLWLLIFATCKQLLWRDPHAAFFSSDGVYDLGYSLTRQAQAHDFIDLPSKEESSAPSRNGSKYLPAICAAVTTFNRPGRQYLNETVGSMLAGLTVEERMDKYGCCTQALVFPRFQVEGLIDFLHERASGQTDALIEEYADSKSYARFAVAPQVVQHVGLISSRNNLAVNTQSTWAFWLEAQDARRLSREHEELVRWSIWRAEGDGS